jgi:hypothetical protein
LAWHAGHDIEATITPGELSADMAEVVNLRIARKRAARRAAERGAAAQRLAHGAAKSERSKTAAERDKASQTLDQHRIEPGDRR